MRQGLNLTHFPFYHLHFINFASPHFSMVNYPIFYKFFFFWRGEGKRRQLLGSRGSSGFSLLLHFTMCYRVIMITVAIPDKQH